MNSILRYSNRGEWGNSSYRGNCTGHIILDLLNQFKPQKFVEVFSGGGTGQDVAQSIGITNSVHLDLNNGWDAMTDEIPVSSDFTFSHPPYWDIIAYGSQRETGHHQNDLSNKMEYTEFINKLDMVNERIYHNLTNGGRHALMIGDVRKCGKYYSPIKDLTWFGDLEAHLIKEQDNPRSSHKIYRGNFIPISHEHILVFRKDQVWFVPIKYTKDFIRDLRSMVNVTWKNLVQAAIEHLGGEAPLNAIYSVLDGCKKGENNSHVKEKIRQTLYQYQTFEKGENDSWFVNLQV
jgi:hypothetical protein